MLKNKKPTNWLKIAKIIKIVRGSHLASYKYFKLNFLILILSPNQEIKKPT
jgi:hypothetical protein